MKNEKLIQIIDTSASEITQGSYEGHYEGCFTFQKQWKP